MNICYVTDLLSPHEMPLANAIANLLEDGCFNYIVNKRTDGERSLLGWTVALRPWVLVGDESLAKFQLAEDLIKKADVVYFGNRAHPLMQWRLDNKKICILATERWFKPPIGFLRLLHPRLFSIYWRFLKQLNSGCLYYFGQGEYACKDFLMLLKIISPTLNNLKGGKRFLRIWGYFTENPSPPPMCRRRSGALRILYAGRLLALKRVDTLLTVIGSLLAQGKAVEFTCVGNGPESEALHARAAAICTRLGLPQPVVRDASSFEVEGETAGKSPFTFLPPVPIAEVRAFMRASDVYVLPSNAYEGWGAVVNEAMAEGCAMVASREAGASATLIRDGENGLLFRSGDAGHLAQVLGRLCDDEPLRLRLAQAGQATLLDLWSPEVAAGRLIAFCQALLQGSTPPVFESGPLSAIR